MSRYIQIEFSNISPEQSDLLIAQLNEAGFEGFEEQQEGLKAFVAEDNFDETSLQELTLSMGLIYLKTFIEETNWNQVWESNFDPVVVGDFVGIRADFHQSIKNVKYEIVITPKMSFGTGHHATTYLMIQQMQELDLAGKSVFDFGTGTGVLAILAEKLGAQTILAIDNDEWSITNAAENIQRNNCKRIGLKLADHPVTNKHFHFILANINKNVILANLETLSKQILTGGCLALSGLLAEDENEVLGKSAECGLHLKQREEMDNWLLLKLTP